MPPVSDKSRRIAAVTALATAIAIPAEGLRQWAYRDPPGILTVCYGHTGFGIEKDRKYSLEECNAFLSEDMQRAIEIVEYCAPGLPENVHAAFADAVFNLGPKIVCNKEKSTAARYLKNGNIDAACRELPRWNKASVGGVMVSLPGLTKRRQKEMELCLA